MNVRLLLALAVLSISVSGCSILRGAGETVEAVGDGTGYAVSRTGEAVDDTTDALADELTP